MLDFFTNFRCVTETALISKVNRNFVSVIFVAENFFPCVKIFYHVTKNKQKNKKRRYFECQYSLLAALRFLNFAWYTLVKTIELHKIDKGNVLLSLIRRTSAFTDVN